jgi:uncharacterized protein YjgD (DUF1641 family)
MIKESNFQILINKYAADKLMKEVEKIWAKREVDEVLNKIYNFEDIMDKLDQKVSLTMNEHLIVDLQLLLRNLDSILAYIKISS